MDSNILARILPLIPERSARAPSGSPFLPEAGALRYPERVAHLAKFLHWLSPLAELGKEDQQALGLLNAAGRPVHAADLMGDEAGEGDEGDEAPLEDGGADALEYMQAETAAGAPTEEALV